MKNFLGSRTEFGVDFDKFVTRTWPEMIQVLEDELGLAVDSAFRRKFDDFYKYIPFYDEYGRCWLVEVTKYHNGDYEVMDYNIHADWADD